MKHKLNWFALAGGTLSLAVVVITLVYPWWQLTVGENLVKVNVSPLTTGFNVFGATLTIPLLLALNLTGILTLVTAGTAMIIYSVIPTRPYSKHILGFGYRKPFYSVVFFVITLFIVTFLVKSFVGLTIPLNGTGTVTLPQNMIEGATLTAQVSSGFLWTFWVEVAAAALCIVARFYHSKIVAEPKPAKDQQVPV